MRKGTVYYRDRIAGELVEADGGYTLTYDRDYVHDPDTPNISAILPKREEPYFSPQLFPFFAGLLAEGENKELQCRYLKLDEDDEFGRLLATSQNDCIGAFYVKEAE